MQPSGTTKNYPFRKHEVHDKAYFIFTKNDTIRLEIEGELLLCFIDQ